MSTDRHRKLWRPSGIAWVAFSGHAIWLVLFGYVFWARSGPPMVGPPCEACEKAADAIQVAIAAVASFVTIRHSAKQAASEVAEETTGRLIEPKLIDYMSKNGVTLLAMTLQQRPEMLFEAAGRALELRSMMGGVTVQEASDIAEGIEEEDGNA